MRDIHGLEAGWKRIHCVPKIKGTSRDAKRHYYHLKSRERFEKRSDALFVGKLTGEVGEVGMVECMWIKI